MATTYSDQAALQNDPKMGNRAAAVQTTGDVRVADVVYTLTGSEAANDIVNLVKLPAGSRVITSLCSVEVENPGTALVIDIGDDDTTADADRYSDGLTVSAGGHFAFSAGGTVAAAELAGHTLDSASWIQADVKTATSLTASQKLRFTIVYAVSG
jgi:hypothetical protein